MNKVHRTTIVTQHTFKKGNWFLKHRLSQHFILNVCRTIQSLKSQPLTDKVFREPFGLWVLQHPRNLYLKHFGIPEVSLMSDTQQFRIGNTRPQEE